MKALLRLTAFAAMMTITHSAMAQEELAASPLYGGAWFTGPAQAYVRLGIGAEFGDLDNDGKDDLVVASHQTDFGGNDLGSVYVRFGDTRANLVPTQNQNMSNSAYYDIRFDGDPAAGNTTRMLS